MQGQFIDTQSVPDELQKRFGARVRLLRHQQALTQQALAENSELHITYIARIEAGNRNPSLKSISAIAKGLGTSIADLMKGVDA